MQFQPLRIRRIHSTMTLVSANRRTSPLQPNRPTFPVQPNSTTSTAVPQKASPTCPRMRDGARSLLTVSSHLPAGKKGLYLPRTVSGCTICDWASFATQSWLAGMVSHGFRSRSTRACSGTSFSFVRVVFKAESLKISEFLDLISSRRRRFSAACNSISSRRCKLADSYGPHSYHPISNTIPRRPEGR